MMAASNDFTDALSEIANRSQSLLGLAATLRAGASTNADLALRVESEFAQLVRAVRRLQPKKEK
jgi:hypothetical protein